ncbi:DNA transporter [Streptomyces sp. NPDC059832]|uniref:DNA transporter n=1 Tax=Streptomyces sp. NPDC059832 TaxID=3346966 RepID=UPI00365CE8F6
MNSADLTAALFAGVVPPDGEEPLAEAADADLARAGYALRHGAYNGLMEAAARGAAPHGVPVTAITLADRSDRGALNPYVTSTVYATTIGARLHACLDDADLVVAMGGGGRLAARTHRRPVLRHHDPLPARAAARAHRVPPGRVPSSRGTADREPTRPLGFLRELPDAAALEADLKALDAGRCER